MNKHHATNTNQHCQLLCYPSYYPLPSRAVLFRVNVTCVLHLITDPNWIQDHITQFFSKLADSTFAQSAHWKLSFAPSSHLLFSCSIVLLDYISPHTLSEHRGFCVGFVMGMGTGTRICTRTRTCTHGPYY